MLASGDLTKAICDRCKLRYPYQELRADGNSPGLRVCEECCDNKDPWRYPAPRPDPIAVRFARPDAPLVSNDTLVINEDGSWVRLNTDEGDLSP